MAARVYADGTIGAQSRFGRDTSCGSARFVTEVALDTGPPGGVAIHTRAHVEVDFAGEDIAFGHFAVTILARVFGFDVRPVAEIDVRGNLIDPHPQIGRASCRERV